MVGNFTAGPLLQINSFSNMQHGYNVISLLNCTLICDHGVYQFYCDDSTFHGVYQFYCDDSTFFTVCSYYV
jgi:hypothetical protein